MRLGQLIKSVQNDLPVTAVQEKWLIANPNPVYSPQALAFAAEVLSGEAGGKRRRKRMFRASGAGSCPRRQVLAFIGHPEVPEEYSSAKANIFATGNFLHLKWQMQGLTAGWLAAAEVPMDRPDLNAGGTADGVLTAEGGWECKSINNRGFNIVMTYSVRPEHEEQTDNYMFLGDLDRYSIVYENKDNGEWREFVRYRDEERMKDVQRRFEVLNTHVADKRLPPILEECMAADGPKYRQCQFRDTCLKLREWPQ